MTVIEFHFVILAYFIEGEGMKLHCCPFLQIVCVCADGTTMSRDAYRLNLYSIFIPQVIRSRSHALLNYISVLFSMLFPIFLHADVAMQVVLDASSVWSK